VSSGICVSSCIHNVFDNGLVLYNVVETTARFKLSSINTSISVKRPSLVALDVNVTCAVLGFQYSCLNYGSIWSRGRIKQIWPADFIGIQIIQREYTCRWTESYLG